MAYSYIQGLKWAAGNSFELAPNDGQDTAFLPLEDIPQPPDVDEFSTFYTEEGLESPVPAGYQQSDGAPRAVDDAYDWFGESADDDGPVIEATAQSQPVEMLAFQDDPVALIDQFEGYDDPVIDLAEALGPVNAQAPPADQPVDDAFDWGEYGDDQDTYPIVDDDDDAVGPDSPPNIALEENEWPDVLDEFQDDSAPVGPDGVQALSLDDWEWVDPGEEYQDESAPVVADVAPVASVPGEDPEQFFADQFDATFVHAGYQQSDAEQNLADDVWDWNESADEDWDADALIGASVVAVASIAADDGWDWGADDDLGNSALIPIGYQKVDGEPNGIDDPWQWDDQAFEDPVEDSAPVGANGQPSSVPEDGWDWFGEPSDDSELFVITDDDDDAVGPDTNALLTVEDPYPHVDEFADDHWQEEQLPVVADVIAPPQQPDDAWDWFDQTYDEIFVDDSAPVADAASALADTAWDFDSDEGAVAPVAFADSYQQDDGEDQPPDDPWDWFETVDEEFLADPVTPPDGQAVVTALPEELWDWSEQADDELVLDAALPDPLNPLLNVEDAWQWVEEFTHDDWQEEQAPVGPNAPPNPLLCVEDAWPWFDEPIGEEEAEDLHRRIENIGISDFNSLRRYVVVGEDRRYIVGDGDRRSIVVGESRVLKVPGEKDQR